jgi:hypothetical protein
MLEYVQKAMDMSKKMYPDVTRAFLLSESLTESTEREDRMAQKDLHIALSQKVCGMTVTQSQKRENE